MPGVEAPGLGTLLYCDPGYGDPGCEGGPGDIRGFLFGGIPRLAWLPVDGDSCEACCCGMGAASGCDGG